jgi:hypothetical protein
MNRRVILPAALILLASPAAWAAQGEDFSFPKFPDTTTPNLGAAVDDTSWNGCFRVNLKLYGVVSTDKAVLRAGWKAGDGLYLSFVVDDAAIAPGDANRIELCFRVDGAPNDWRLIVDPFGASLPAMGVFNAPAGIQCWRNSGSWAPATPAPDWPAANAKVSHAASTWTVAMRIPFSALPSIGIDLTAPGTFKAYINILSRDNMQTGDRQIPWPATVNVPTGDVTTTTPAPSFWALHSLRQSDDDWIPPIGGLAGLPAIDGEMENDKGWNGALRVNLNDAYGVPRKAVIQAGLAGNDFYLGINVKGGYGPSEGDRVVVGIASTPGDATKDWRIIIEPFGSTPAAGPPQSALRWRNSGTWNNAGAAGTSALTTTELLGGVNGDVKVGFNGTEWTAEMKFKIHNLPASAGDNDKVYLPATGIFQIYVNALDTTTTWPYSVSQMAWPACAEIYPFSTDANTDVLENNMPAPARWIRSSLNDRPECTGITLSWDRIGIKDPSNPAVIISDMRRYGPIVEADQAAVQALPDNHNWPATKGPPNVFTAQPYNGMSNPATKVTATFRLANWGVPSAESFAVIQHPAAVTPPLVNPTLPAAPEATIAAGASGDLSMTWELSYKESGIYKYANPNPYDSTRSHQCIQVDLDSTDPAVRFKNKSVQRNMDFVEASVFMADARVSSRGHSPPAAGRPKHLFAITVDSSMRPYVPREKGTPVPEVRRESAERKFRPQPPREPEPHELAQYPAGTTEMMTWIARAYRMTGINLRIAGTEYEVAGYMGGYGVVAGHKGKARLWLKDIYGTGLKRMQEGYYTLELGVNEEARLTTRIEAREPGSKLTILILLLALIAGAVIVVILLKRKK